MSALGSLSLFSGVSRLLVGQWISQSTNPPILQPTSPQIHRSMSPKKILAVFAVASLAACSKKPAETQPEPETVGARINTNLEAPIAHGDCREATKRARANPNINDEKERGAPHTHTQPDHC